MKIEEYAYRSGMKNWNSGIKVVLAVGTLCFSLAFDRILVSLFVILSMSVLTVRIGKIPWKRYLYWLTIPLAFMAINGLVMAVIVAETPLGNWNLELPFAYLCVSKTSLLEAVTVFLKGLAGTSALYMLSFSTPMYQILFVLRKLHVPELMLELMHLIYRYIFILLELQHQMQTAARARMGYRNFAHSVRSFAKIAGNLLLRSLKKANTYYDALVSRGYNGRLEFLMEEEPVHVWQITGCISYFLMMGMLFGIAL